MAHPAAAGQEQEHNAVIIGTVSPKMRSARLSAIYAHPLKTNNIKNFSIHHQPLRDVTNAIATVKTRETISVAGVFKKNKRKDSHPRDKKAHQSREKSPDLIHKYIAGFEEARHTINTNAVTTFEAAHSAFHEELLGFRASDEKFAKNVSKRADVLRAPLTTEEIQTEFRRDGKKVTEIAKIGDRVETFKKLMTKEEAKLKEYWKQWDEVQNEYIALGIEVFGPEPFGQDADSSMDEDTGFKREMELLDLEHNTRLEELDADIEDIGLRILTKIKNSEKELDSAAKKAQKKILDSLIG